MAPIIYVSKSGFASCPSCLSHIRLDVERDETVCPFCEEELTIAARAAKPGFGAMKLLKGSRSGLLAAALAGAGLSLTMACGDPDDPDPDPVEQDVGTQAGFNTGEGDAGSSASSDAGNADPSGDDVEYEDVYEEPIPVQDYGMFPNDYPNEEPNMWEEPPPEDVGVEEDVNGGSVDVGVETDVEEGSGDAG